MHLSNVQRRVDTYGPLAHVDVGLKLFVQRVCLVARQVHPDTCKSKFPQITSQRIHCYSHALSCANLLLVSEGLFTIKLPEQV